MIEPKKKIAELVEKYGRVRTASILSDAFYADFLTNGEVEELCGLLRDSTVTLAWPHDELTDTEPVAPVLQTGWDEGPDLRVGDLMPALYDGERNENICGVLDPDTWTCTRHPQHAGKHWAGTGTDEEILAVWS